MIAANRSGPAFFDGIAVPTDREFQLFGDLIRDYAGIHLAESKKALLYGRMIRRIRELGLDSFAAYYRRVVDEDKDEIIHMIDRIATNETHFFREPNHFEYLEQTLLPNWMVDGERGLRSKRLRIWSAGCSTGEEPFSLAMVALAHLPATSGWSVEILASDISTRVLGSAARATWSIEKAREIPAPYLKRFMLHGIGAQQGRLRAAPELRELVSFERVNLNGDTYPQGEPFDLIFCRNVLIYFKPARKQHVIERLVARLAPGGRLFVGHAESVQCTRLPLTSVRPTVYARPDVPRPGAP